MNLRAGGYEQIGNRDSQTGGARRRSYFSGVQPCAGIDGEELQGF